MYLVLGSISVLSMALNRVVLKSAHTCSINPKALDRSSQLRNSVGEKFPDSEA